MNKIHLKQLFLCSISPMLLACGSMQDAGHYGPDRHPHSPQAYPEQFAQDAASFPDEPEPETNNGPNGDKYEAPGTNPYVITASDPQSTFAVDVDTASYDIFRRDINHGYLPNEDSVRLEEFVNYFPYDYAQPTHDSATPFAITVDAATNPYTPGTTLLSVGIKGQKIPPHMKKPANLVFLVDVSGSMSGPHKLPLVKKVFSEALNVLDPTDTVSIVSYAGHTAVRLEPTPVAEKSTITAVLNSLSSGGGTAGSSGINLAYEQAEAGFIDDGINHVVLCTDGDFNVGQSSDSDLVDLITEKRKSGITLTVLGFGSGNLNDSMMEKITNAGNGVYGVIANLDQAINYVHKRLLSTILLIAKDVKFQIEFNPELVYGYRLLGYENRALADHQFLDDTVDAGEVGAEHTVTALYELVLAGDELPTVENAPEVQDNGLSDLILDVNPNELCLIKIRYKHMEATEQDPATQINRPLDATMIHESLEDASPNLQWASAVAAFAEILKGSPYGSLDNLETIQSMVEQHAGADADRLEFTSLLNLSIELMTSAE